MRAYEIIREGGWANPITQNTIITPQLVEKAWAVIKGFEGQVNQFLQTKSLPPVEIVGTAGSATYYKRDLVQQPDKQYGDIDVNMLVPRLPDMTNNANMATYSNAIKEFCDASVDFQTKNGTNVIFKLGADYVQVDLVISFTNSREWIKALAPEWNVKGVLCNSLYSSLGEALNLSFGGGLGVQVKTIDNVPVKFSTQKGVQLHTITLDPHNWGVDIARYFGVSDEAIANSYLEHITGMKDEPRVKDICYTIIGICQALGYDNLLQSKGLNYPSGQHLQETILSIYCNKIEKAINSSKFDKAETVEAYKKAEKTKQMLRDGMKVVIGHLGQGYS